jgi:hypothetical protein
MQGVYETSRAKADELNVDLNFLGYSLGAVLNADLMSNNAEVRYRTQVLLAPAFTPTIFLKTIHVFGESFNDAIIPSISPEGYRANPGTSVAAYRALQESADEFSSDNTVIASDVLAFADKRDELVNVSKLEESAIEKRFHRYRFQQIEKKNDNAKPYHLIIDQESMDADIWRQLVAAMLEHFDL